MLHSIAYGLTAGKTAYNINVGDQIRPYNYREPSKGWHIGLLSESPLLACVWYRFILNWPIGRMGE
jgi:hypothetical protein